MVPRFLLGGDWLRPTHFHRDACFGCRRDDLVDYLVAGHSGVWELLPYPIGVLAGSQEPWPLGCARDDVLDLLPHEDLHKLMI